MTDREELVRRKMVRAHATNLVNKQEQMTHHLVSMLNTLYEDYDHIIWEEFDSIFADGLSASNIIEYEPTYKWLGPKTVFGHYRCSQKSDDLMSKLLKLFISPSENVLENNIWVHDIFMGTGSTGEAALKSNCNFFGNDRCPIALDVTKNDRIIKLESY